MAEGVIKLKASKSGYDAEIEIPWSLICDEKVNLDRIDPILSKLYTIINNQIVGEHHSKGNTKFSPPNSKTETEPLGKKRDDSSQQSHSDLDEQVANKSLKEVLENSSNWREVELLLIFIYYAADFGRDDVKRDDIIEMYKYNGKETVSRKRNLTNNLQTLSKYKWISATSEGYHMTDEGNYRAKGIIARGKTEDIPQ